MGLLGKKRNAAVKRSEATTDDSQKSSNSWKNKLRFFSFSHSLYTQNRKQAKQQSSKDQSESQRKIAENFPGSTDSEMDLFQTLMSNSVPPIISQQPTISSRVKVDTPGGAASKNHGSELYWHRNDPNFLPTAYPFMRTDGRSRDEPKWGTLNLAASAALVDHALHRFNSVRDKHPRFRFGPRLPPGEGEHSQADRLSGSSAGSEKSRSLMDAYTPRYSFIYQGGKLVEREVTRWPVHKKQKIEMRYRFSEPYSKSYGKMAKRHQAFAMQKYTLPKTRYIYQRPIYKMPRKIMEENKKRLMARHTLKESFEPGKFRLPFSHSLGESEQSRRYMENQTTKYIKETEERIAHVEKQKRKAQSHDALLYRTYGTSVSAEA